MEENNDIFLAGGDALVYLAEPMYKKYSTKLFWGNSFSTYVSYDVLFSPCTQLHTFLMNSPPFPQLRTYLMDGLFLNQKTNNNIPISYSLKYKHSKKNKFFKSQPVQRYCTWSQINGIIIVHFKSNLSQWF